MLKLEKVVLNESGIRELLKTPEVKELCRECASNVQMRAGDDYVVEERNYPERSGFSIRPDSPKAHRSNLKNNTLLKALQG